jgi:FlaA1/EpsC-like NDP-sugar epimerase
MGATGTITRSGQAHGQTVWFEFARIARRSQTATREIVIPGLVTGEKLYEELLIGDDPQPTGYERT